MGSVCYFCYDCYLSLLVQPVTLDLCDSVASAMDQASSVIHPFAGVDFPSAYRAGLIARVTFVMIVIFKDCMILDIRS